MKTSEQNTNSAPTSANKNNGRKSVELQPATIAFLTALCQQLKILGEGECKGKRPSCSLAGAWLTDHLAGVPPERLVQTVKDLSHRLLPPNQPYAVAGRFSVRVDLPEDDIRAQRLVGYQFRTGAWRKNRIDDPSLDPTTEAARINALFSDKTRQTPLTG